MCCSRSTTTPPSTGSICAPRTPSSQPSPPCAFANRVTKGHGSRAAGIAMAFKLIESAQIRWRAVNAPHLVALVRAGARFEKANSSNDPTNQEVISKSRDTPIHRS